MTSREFYQEIINVLQVQQIEGRNDAELYSNTADCNVLVDKALAQIAALDARNEKRKDTESKDKREARERREAVLNFLRDHQGEQFTRDGIAEGLGITPAQASAACKVLAADGSVVKAEIKVEKSRKVGYSAA